MPAYRDGKQWRWRAQFTRSDGTVAKGSGTPPVNSKEAAKASEQAWREEQKHGAPPKAKEVPTLRAFAADYLADVKLHRSPATHHNRAGILRTHLLPRWGHLRLDAITVARINELKKDLLATHKVSTINEVLSGLSNILRTAVSWGRLRSAPKVARLPKPVEDGADEEFDFLSHDELEALLTCATPTERAMVAVAARAGLRRGEVVSLRWVDVDLAQRRLRVRRNVWRSTSRPTKSKRARTVPLAGSVVAALSALPQAHERVFTAGAKPVGYETARRWLSSLCTRAQVRQVGWHTLRHTFGTHLAMAGVPIKTISEWMGHADIKTTMVYAHYYPAMMDGVIEVLDSKPGPMRSVELAEGPTASPPQAEISGKNGT
jgi:integrase